MRTLTTAFLWLIALVVSAEEEVQKMKNGTTNGVPNKQIVKNLPFAARGYVFKNPELNVYFSRIWWYMPDPNWKERTSGFSQTERELINSYK